MELPTTAVIGVAQAGAGILYTTDKHIEAHKEKGVRTVNLTSGMKNQ